MTEQTGNIEVITVTVGQKKSTNYSKESFDANESITLTDTTALEAGLLRKILRVKLMGSIVYDMIAFDSMVSEALVPGDVQSTVHISNHLLGSITAKISESSNVELPNKDILVSHLGVAKGIIDDITEQLEG